MASRVYLLILTRRHGSSPTTLQNTTEKPRQLTLEKAVTGAMKFLIKDFATLLSASDIARIGNYHGNNKWNEAFRYHHEFQDAQRFEISEGKFAYIKWIQARVVLYNGPRISTQPSAAASASKTSLGPGKFLLQITIFKPDFERMKYVTREVLFKEDLDSLMDGISANFFYGLMPDIDANGAMLETDFQTWCCGASLYSFNVKVVKRELSKMALAMVTQASFQPTENMKLVVYPQDEYDSFLWIDNKKVALRCNLKWDGTATQSSSLLSAPDTPRLISPPPPIPTAINTGAARNEVPEVQSPVAKVISTASLPPIRTTGALNSIKEEYTGPDQGLTDRVAASSTSTVASITTRSTPLVKLQTISTSSFIEEVIPAPEHSIHSKNLPDLQTTQPSQSQPSQIYNSLLNVTKNTFAPTDSAGSAPLTPSFTNMFSFQPQINTPRQSTQSTQSTKRPIKKLYYRIPRDVAITSADSQSKFIPPSLTMNQPLVQNQWSIPSTPLPMVSSSDLQEDMIDPKLLSLSSNEKSELKVDYDGDGTMADEVSCISVEDELTTLLSEAIDNMLLSSNNPLQSLNQSDDQSIKVDHEGDGEMKDDPNPPEEVWVAEVKTQIPQFEPNTYQVVQSTPSTVPIMENQQKVEPELEPMDGVESDPNDVEDFPMAEPEEIINTAGSVQILLPTAMPLQNESPTIFECLRVPETIAPTTQKTVVEPMDVDSAPEELILETPAPAPEVVPVAHAEVVETSECLKSQETLKTPIMGEASSPDVPLEVEHPDCVEEEVLGPSFLEQSPAQCLLLSETLEMEDAKADPDPENIPETIESPPTTCHENQHTLTATLETEIPAEEPAPISSPKVDDMQAKAKAPINNFEERTSKKATNIQQRGVLIQRRQVSKQKPKVVKKVQFQEQVKPEKEIWYDALDDEGLEALEDENLMWYNALDEQGLEELLDRELVWYDAVDWVEDARVKKEEARIKQAEIQARWAAEKVESDKIRRYLPKPLSRPSDRRKAQLAIQRCVVAKPPPPDPAVEIMLTDEEEEKEIMEARAAFLARCKVILQEQEKSIPLLKARTEALRQRAAMPPMPRRRQPCLTERQLEISRDLRRPRVRFVPRTIEV